METDQTIKVEIIHFFHNAQVIFEETFVTTQGTGQEIKAYFSNIDLCGYTENLVRTQP